MRIFISFLEASDRLPSRWSFSEYFSSECLLVWPNIIRFFFAVLNNWNIVALIGFVIAGGDSVTSSKSWCMKTTFQIKNSLIYFLLTATASPISSKFTLLLYYIYELIWLSPESVCALNCRPGQIEDLVNCRCVDRDAIPA